MMESAAKAWANFMDGEKKLPERIQSQLQLVIIIGFNILTILKTFFFLFFLEISTSYWRNFNCCWWSFKSSYTKKT